MEVKKGYKQTEVGVIPEDWEVKPIGAIASIATGNTPPTSNVTYYGDEFLFVSPVDMGYAKYISHTEKMLSRNGFAISRRFPKDSILFVCIGSTIGKCGIASQDLTSNQQINAIFPSAALSTSFVYYAISSVAHRIKALAGEQAVPIVNKTQFSATPIPLPTVAEQRAIAEALSDADALIESLEQLIAKKRLIKRGAMQVLLTGKKRLPGFSGEWKVKRLGDIAEIVMGQSPSSLYYNSKGDGLPLIQGNADIVNRVTIKRVFTSQITKRGRCGDVLMSVRAPVGEISRALFDVCLGRGVCAIRYPNDYIYHVLLATESLWARLSTGSTFDAVNSSTVKDLELRLPSEVNEQTAIATVLSDMDTELAALEEKLAKSRALKQGMMQELLTGRIRLV